MKVTRYYASQENALNVRTIIQDLLVSELERILVQPAIEKNPGEKKHQLGSECA
ncbi:hypothetical protein [Niallia sp. MER TA 168]|uniref:hypothetical protein n=1 Tax=Niallia sp. MER TA 168 TaxID=2939568 RepID=UPI00203DBC3F|nr:hypothetical protein [Niallia sp. MER TA 168]MCM3361276.1 hypothetical protein [Niallia sp. MER TA 168]